jgi:hypothetical protein
MRTLRKDEPPFPKVWVALPAPLPLLGRATEAGKPVAAGPCLATVLIAAERAP